MSDVTDLKAEVLLLRKENERLHSDQAHWELGNCPSCPNIADLQEALEQNAKLRALADGAANEADRLTHDAAALQIENAKLREQVDYMTPLALYGASERERDRMRELGIEVDA